MVGNYEDSSAKLVKAINAQVTDWGIAGDGLRWKPVLKLEAAPGQESRSRAWRSLAGRRCAGAGRVPAGNIRAVAGGERGWHYGKKSIH